MDQKTQESVVNYLEKSQNTIQRLTETNEILTVKNRELLAKTIFYQTKIKLLREQNKELKKRLSCSRNEKVVETTCSETENEFEIL